MKNEEAKQLAKENSLYILYQLLSAAEWRRTRMYPGPRVEEDIAKIEEAIKIKKQNK